MGHIGKNIKKIRSVKGLSQQAFADLFNLSRGNISSYEEGRAEPKIEIILQIANYFSIPLELFIQKDLSVNELLNYKSTIVVDAEKFALSQKLASIPFVPGNYVSEYLLNFDNEEYIDQLPHIVLPYNNTKQKVVAIELTNPDILPTGFNFTNGDILLFEKVEKENIHRIMQKLGVILDGKDIRCGIYKNEADKIWLELNEFIQYSFNLDSKEQYWVLKAFYSQYQ